jgi:membrane-bound serine protease (ClpP class)
VLKLTTKEEIANAYCNAQAKTIHEVLTKEGISTHEITVFKPFIADKIIARVTNPTVSSVLILLMIGGFISSFNHRELDLHY